MGFFPDVKIVSVGWKKNTPYYYDGLRKFNYDLFGFRFKPHFKVGLTPKVFPDIFISFGPLFKAMFGKTTINESQMPINLLAGANFSSSFEQFAHGFFEVELVFLRFGNSALSWFTTRSSTSGSIADYNLSNTAVDNMSNFYISRQPRVWAKVSIELAMMSTKIATDLPSFIDWCEGTTSNKN